MIRKVLLGYSCNIYGRGLLTYFMPLWSTHLVKDPPVLNGSFFGIALGCCALGFAFIAPLSLKGIKTLGRRPIIYMGIVLMLIGAGVMAADIGNVLNSGGAKMGFYILGSMVTSMGYGMMTIPVLPEILDAIEANLKSKGLVVSK